MAYKYNPFTRKLYETKRAEGPSLDDLPFIEFKNRLINGSFRFYQRGSLFRIKNDKKYTADRWLSGAFDDNDIQCSTIIPGYVLDILDDNSCLACWNLDRDFLDLSGNYPLTGHDVSFTEDGMLYECIDYNNAPETSYMVTNNKIARGGTNEISISAWIYVYGSLGKSISIWHLSPDNNNNNGNSRQPALWLCHDDNTKFTIKNDGVTHGDIGIYKTTGGITFNEWHHIVVTVGLQTIQLYIDGELTDEFTASENFKHNDGYFYIGNKWHYKNFKIDQVRIFKKILTAEEINHIRIEEMTEREKYGLLYRVKLVNKGSSNNVIPLEQRIEGTFAYDLILQKEKVTVSFELASNVNRDFKVAIKNPDESTYAENTVSYSGSGNYQLLSTTFDLSSIDTTNEPDKLTEREAFRLVIGEGDLEYAGDWIKIKNIQMEEGEEATYFENIPVDVEYLRCIRYYRIMDDNSYNHFKKLVVMRTDPTISHVGSYYIYDAEL